MKHYLGALAIWLGLGGSLLAQEPLQFQVTNPKGKSLGSKAFIFLSSNAAGQPLDRKSDLRLRPMPQDTIFVLTGNYLGKIPIDSTFTAKRLSVVFYKGQLTNPESGETYAVEKLPPFDPNDISHSREISVYNNLETLIRGKFPNLLIRVNNQDNTKYLVLTTDQTTPMLILVDGVTMSSFTHANQIVDVRQVKSIRVKRSDPLYGFRGTGGIVEITLVKGGDL